MPAKDDYESFAELAARVFGEEDDSEQDRQDYIDWHMERLGYKRQSFWEDNDDKASEGNSNPFSKRRESRNVGGGSGKERKRGFGMGQYGA